MLSHQIQDTRTLCEAFLSASARGTMPPPAECFNLLSVFDGSEDARTKALAFLGRERELLCTAALETLRRLEAFPASDAMKAAFCDEFRFCADTPARWLDQLAVNGVRFKELARVVTLRRFPGGQFHWEVSGVPRSFFFKAGTSASFSLARFILGKTKGLFPFWEIHVNARRRIPSAILEKEADASYRSMAENLLHHPEIRGMMTASWLFDPRLGAVSPRLAWIHRNLAARGAGFFDIEVAPENAGFLVGSQERQIAYRQGAYRPSTTLVLWPRSAILAWAQL